MKHLRLCPRYTGDTSWRACCGCWRDLPASAFGARNGSKYLRSYCRECHRGIAARSARRRYWARGEGYRKAKSRATCEARRARRAA
jgi:hypothetical protein